MLRHDLRNAHPDVCGRLGVSNLPTLRVIRTQFPRIRAFWWAREPRAVEAAGVSIFKVKKGLPRAARKRKWLGRPTVYIEVVLSSMKSSCGTKVRSYVREMQ